MPLRLRFPKHLGAVAGIALAGLLAGWAGYSLTRDRLRRDTTRAAARYAVSFAAAELQALTGTRADVDGAAYAMVRARLERLVELDPQVRTIRLIRDRVDENRIVLLAIATRPEIGNASLPGEDYAALQTSPAFQAALRTGEPAAEGPFPAAAGAWLRGYAAVFHPEDGAARAPVRDFLVLGLRPEQLHFEDGPCRIQLTADLCENLGGATLIHGQTANGETLALQTPGRRMLKKGEAFSAGFDAAGAYLFAPDGRAL